MSHRTLAIPSILVALLLAACTGAGATSTPQPSKAPPAAQARQGLEGRTFLSTAIDGRALVAGSRVRLAFAAGRIGASAGCNSMGGTYAIDGDLLVAGQLATTEMACDPALMEQDQWLAGLLGGATIALQGDVLTLAADGVRLTLLDREVADPDRPLTGTRWIVDGLVEGEAVASVPAGVVAALTFSPDRVAVEAGCNQGAGAVAITDETLAFGPIGLTKMACPADAMAVEQAVTDVLRGQVAWAIEADALTLRAGGVGLLLRAAP